MNGQIKSILYFGALVVGATAGAISLSRLENTIESDVVLLKGSFVEAKGFSIPSIYTALLQTDEGTIAFEYTGSEARKMNLKFGAGDSLGRRIKMIKTVSPLSMDFYTTEEGGSRIE